MLLLSFTFCILTLTYAFYFTVSQPVSAKPFLFMWHFQLINEPTCTRVFRSDDGLMERFYFLQANSIQSTLNLYTDLYIYIQLHKQYFFIICVLFSSSITMILFYYCVSPEVIQFQSYDQLRLTCGYQLKSCSSR